MKNTSKPASNNITHENVVGISVSANAGAEDAYADSLRLQSMIRSAMINAGLGKKNPLSPFSDLIDPGMTVLVKPNWVHHENQGGLGMDCMLTHPSFIYAVLKLLALARPGKVILGDAPIQGCKFERIVTPEFRELFHSFKFPVEIVDFRLVVYRGHSLAEGVLTHDDQENTIRFNLASSSMLEKISSKEGLFRVTNYDPIMLNTHHSPGNHQYLVSRWPFTVDMMISLPKLKTHKKAGLTGALKNLVGISVSKDYLPHHRLGGTAQGGDCYPVNHPLKNLLEFCLDQANQRIGMRGFKYWRTCARICSRCLYLLSVPTDVEGSWAGNDTVWRMVLDLNRILEYGKVDGTISSIPQRQILTITDAIIAGDGEGPLSPSPVNLGVVTCSTSPVHADIAHASLMGFDWTKIPLVRAGWEQLTGHDNDALLDNDFCSMEGNRFSINELYLQVGKDFSPPQGWIGQIETKRGR